MAGVIVLVRHGPSSLTVRGWHTRDGVAQSRLAYDLAGVQSSGGPPDSLRRVAATAGVIVSSDLLRAVESGQWLAGDRPVILSPLLREIPLEIPEVRGRLPIVVWEALIHLNWVYANARGHDFTSAQRLQVQTAADWLVAQARESMVLGVTHGVMRRALWQQLATFGWRRQRVQGGYRPWSAWFFEAVETRASHAPPRSPI